METAFYLAKCKNVDDLAVMLNDEDGIQHAIIIFRKNGKFTRPRIPDGAPLDIMQDACGRFAEEL